MTAPFTTRPELAGTFGMVSSTHYLASAAAMAELEAGGNAVDAAVAAGFTLQVVEPHLNGPGGDMTLMFSHADAQPVVLCGQGPAPAAATVQAMVDRGLDRVPGSGVAAAAVPASTVAWLTLLRDHGTRSISDVLKYAIHYARNGFPVLPQIAATIERVAELFATEWAGSAAHYLRGGTPVVAGSFLTNPAQADTYQRLLAAAGPAASREQAIDAAIAEWSTGSIAAAIADFAATEQADGLGGRYPGLLTGDDMASLTIGYEAAVTVDFHGWTVAKMAAWGQGPVLLQQLRLVDGLLDGVEPGSADWLHIIVEASKLAFADRDAWYGDPADDQPQVPLATLLSREYAADRAALIGPAASMDLRPGAPDGRTPVLPTWDSPSNLAASPTSGEPTVSRAGETRGDTCHVSVVDRFGTMVAATPSGGWLQSSPLIPELGFPLGTRLQMTTLEPNLPTTLTPGRRPRSTLSPSLAVHADGRRLAFGTPGGDQQDQWQVSFFLGHVLGGLNLQQAIDAPSFHSTHFPSSFHPRESFPGQLIVEDRFAPGVVEELERRGHLVVRSGPWSLGRLCAVAREVTNAGGLPVLRAGANPRGMQGYAVGR